MKRLMLTTIIFFIFILFPAFLFPAFSWGATHYVTPTGGAISKDGSNWTNAYQGLPSSLTRGDVYVVAGGNYSAKTFSDTESGTTLITIRKASSLSSYRDDLVTGWSSSYETTQAVFTGATVFNTGYYTIDGVIPPTGHWQTSGYGIKFFGVQSGTISYLVWTSQTASVNNITLKHIVFQNLGSSYGDIEQIAISTRGVGYYYDSWTISHCYFHDSQLFIKPTGYAPKGWIIEHNYFGTNWSSSAHHGVQLSISGLGSSTPHRIRYNWFEPHQGTGSIMYYVGGGTCTANDISIYGNVWHNPGTLGTGNGIFGTGDSGSPGLSYNNWKIYNNTFVASSGGQVPVTIGGSSPPPTGWEIRNNLFYNCTTSDTAAGTFTNNYRNNSPWGWGTCTNCVTSTESQATLFPNYASGDYHPSAGSQAVGTGYALSSPYNVDADGIYLPQGSAWNIGSYQSLTGGTLVKPMPPLGLIIN